MALNKKGLTNDLKRILSHPQTEDNVNRVAQALADAIDRYIKSGQVVGVCPPNGGPLTGGKII